MLFISLSHSACTLPSSTVGICTCSASTPSAQVLRESHNFNVRDNSHVDVPIVDGTRARLSQSVSMISRAII